MGVYHIVGLLAFVVVAATLLIHYVNATVDREFRNLARAVSDSGYRNGELARVDGLLADKLPLPPDARPVAKSGGGRGFFPLVLLAVGVILLWGGAFAREERGIWLYSGLAATLVSGLFMLITLKRRKWERIARLLRFRADLRRLDGNRGGAAEDLGELIKLTPWDDASWAELSDDLAADGKLEDALDAVRQAGRLDPGYDEYRMLEASLALRTGKLDMARDALKSWAELGGAEPSDPRLAIYRAALDLAEGRRDAAADSLKDILLDEDSAAFEFLDTDSALEDVKRLLPGKD